MKKHLVTAALVFASLPAHASFIESTMGTAVVNDATATYYNPAALSLLKHSQIVALDSYSVFQSKFSGQAVQRATGFTQSGVSNANSHFSLPAIYFGSPLKNKFFGGVAIIENDFDRDLEGHTILRYVQASNEVNAVDVVPAIAYQLNDKFTIGAGLTFSHARFLTRPITGLPSLNIPDSQSRNDTDGNGWGGDVGFVFRPSTSTVLGFNYRSAVTYHLSGISTLYSNPILTSNQYQFKYWTPARSVISINQFLTPKLGLVGTVQYLQWSIFKYVHLNNIATQVGLQPTIIPSATVPYHFHNSWIVTLGSFYRFSPQLIVRAAGSFIQAPSSGNYQIDNGNSFLLGGSAGYQLYKNLILDGSYAHAFVQNKSIHIVNRLNTVTGVNQSSGNAVSLKLTFNID